jgi:hypothetical protein
MADQGRAAAGTPVSRFYERKGVVEFYDWHANKQVNVKDTNT